MAAVNFKEGTIEMAVNTDFNVGANAKAPRRLLRTYVDVGEGEREWFLVGSGIEESSIELNPDTETITDILGVTTTTVNKWEAAQSFDPFTIKGGSKLAFKLHQIWQDKTPEKLSQFDVMIVYKYIGSNESGYEAEIQNNCTINITSIGGSAYVDMPIEITYSNDIVRGTVTFDSDVPTFKETEV